MYPPLWTSLLVAMHDDIENTSIGGFTVTDFDDFIYKLSIPINGGCLQKSVCQENCFAVDMDAEI